MPFKKNKPSKEKGRLKELVNTSDVAKKAYDEFGAYYEFRKKLVSARKNEKITQKELGESTKLSQQAISRIETGGTNVTIETLIKYLDGIGYELVIKKHS